VFLIDCGSDAVLDTLNAWQEQGRFAQLEGCWVTHYHDDHVDALHHLAGFWHTPIYAQEQFAEIVAHPSRFYLPCISPAPAPVDHPTLDGETWQWHEFEMTSLHFPGQTLYHGGLLLRGHGLSVLFCGDSFAPSGLDDYTAGNRNFLGTGRGYRRCIELIRQHRPDLILNQHQQKAFHFSEEQLAYMEQMLIAREGMLQELLPWEHINYGTDEGWIRTYPYELETSAGATCLIEVRASQHAAQPVSLSIEAVLPPGWSCEVQNRADVPGVGSGGDCFSHRAAAVHIPAGVKPGSYPLPFRVTWGGRCLGQVCHALVRVKN
jgi:glyoxylase-like metal-dependent hydrolase (beta-lactamase superfamily II)